MFIDNLNLNHIRVFETVYRTRSMTAASRELHLTQSGVSQHMKSLEEMLGVRLFDRVRQRLVPTAAGTILFGQCSQSLTQIEQALWEIKGEGRQLAGKVSIGMPIEFGNNVIMPLLSKFSRKHPGVKFKLRLGFASEMNELLLKGDLDFAFVDDYAMDRSIESERVYDESLELCISEELLKRKTLPSQQNRKFFESLEYVDYQDDEPILRMWFKHHLGSANLPLNVRATVMDVQGVARLILTELGAGVLPSHLIAKLGKESRKLHRFKGCGKPLKNAISIASLRERTHSPAAKLALTTLKGELNGD